MLTLPDDLLLTLAAQRFRSYFTPFGALDDQLFRLRAQTQLLQEATDNAECTGYELAVGGICQALAGIADALQDASALAQALEAQRDELEHALAALAVDAGYPVSRERWQQAHDNARNHDFPDYPHWLLAALARRQEVTP